MKKTGNLLFCLFFYNKETKNFIFINHNGIPNRITMTKIVNSETKLNGILKTFRKNYKIINDLVWDNIDIKYINIIESGLALFMGSFNNIILGIYDDKDVEMLMENKHIALTHINISKIHDDDIQNKYGKYPEFIALKKSINPETNDFNEEIEIYNYNNMQQEAGSIMEELSKIESAESEVEKIVEEMHNESSDQ